jgi:hypothetical protein
MLDDRVYTPPPIAGYRNLTQAEVDAINQIKNIGKELDGAIAAFREHLKAQRAAAGPDHTKTREIGFLPPNRNPAEMERLDHAEPERWLAMARTDLQTGLMKLVRAIAQPASF